MRDVRYTSAGSFEHSSTLIPVRIRSFEDLSISMTNTIHRSASDSALHDSSPIPSRLNITPASSNVQQSPSNRLLNSTSNNSLFGPPHQLGTPPDNPVSPSNCNPTSPWVPPSPDAHQIKKPSFPVDDSSSDIQQLVATFQKYPMNVNSVDSILRVIARPSKHTNSLSSTTSSLSEISSLTRISSYEQNQAQRMVSSTRVRENDHLERQDFI